MKGRDLSTAGWLGLDIGGANCKLATDGGESFSFPFALWVDPDGLAPRLAEAIGSIDPTGKLGLAITMTGELADCFRTRAEGVARIVAAVERIGQGRPTRYWGTDRRFRAADQAIVAWERIAAANWHATATWLANELFGAANDDRSPRIGLLIDVGSTTTDLIPFDATGSIAHGATDRERLATGELVYIGMRRTPIAAIVRSLTLRGERIPVAAERFATTLDAHLLLEAIDEAPSDHETADGRPALREHAWDRLVRMLGEDRNGVTLVEARELASQIARRQRTLIDRAIRRAIDRIGRPSIVMTAGEGSRFAAELSSRRVPDAAILDLADRFDPGIARAAPAHAVARLARASFGSPARGIDG